MKNQIRNVFILFFLLTFVSACSKETVSYDENDTTEMELVSDNTIDEDVISDNKLDEDQKTDIETVQPDEMQIRSICKLATLECYYHNVAISSKAAGHGVTHWGEKDRDFWVEYSGVVKLGVDMSKGRMEINGTEITIYIPKAEIISMEPDESSVQDPICATDGWNKNDIGANDVTVAVANAEEAIKNQIKNDSALLVSAQDRAKKLIENYIEQLGKASGVEFTVKWEYI